MASIKGIIPDVLLIAVVYFALFYGVKTGLEAGLAVGFLKDLFTLGPFGLHMMIFGLAGFIVGAISEKVYRENILVQFIIVFISGYFTSRFNLYHALYTAVIAPPLIMVLKLSTGYFAERYL